MLIRRDSYLLELDRKRFNGLVKVLTGVRRCGKSYLLFKLFRDHLLSLGVPVDNIICLALDEIESVKYHVPEHLYYYIKARVREEGQYYVLLDEVQLVPNFESVLLGLLHIENVDVYVTGSNSKFLSSDIITEFRGRGDQVHVYPLSFAEYFNAMRDAGNMIDNNMLSCWHDYMLYGGMPKVLSINTERDKMQYLSELFTTVYNVDILERYKLRGVAEIESLTKVVASTIGSLMNPKRISDTFLSVEGQRVAPNTVTRYLDYLQDSFLISKANRFDVQGRRYIGTPQKYYFVDPGLRNACLGFRQPDESHVLENIIYIELLRRGYSVDVGALEVREMNSDNSLIRKQLEVDFVANLGNKRYYIQSALNMDTEEKRQQEWASLKRIKDGYQRVVIKGGYCKPYYDENGFLTIGVLNFLLSPEDMDS